jgi:hypothetical protein
MPEAAPMTTATFPSSSRRLRTLSSTFLRSRGQYSTSQASASDRNSKPSTTSAPAIAWSVAL